MKVDLKKIFALALIGTSFALAGWNFSLTTQGAYYIENEVKTGDEHFAKPAGPFDGGKALTRFNAAYSIPTPLGEHWLLKGASVDLIGSLEFSPVNLMPALEIGFTPVPFLVFGAGASIGSGWNVLGFEGLTKYDFATADYENLTPFAHYYYNLWASGTFQFDLGAILDGEWLHVVMSATYKVYYEGLTGVDDGEIWQWKETDKMANGLQYNFTGVLGYRMPMAWSMVGILVDIYGHFDKDDYGDVANRFDGDFTNATVGLLSVFSLNEKNSLTTLLSFQRSRSYSTPHDDEDQEPLLRVTGGEWSFYSIAFSWEHKF